VLYRFTAGRDGGTPAGELAIDATTGVLYGSTWFGGRNASNDCCGTIFKLAPPAQKSGSWRFTTLFRFSGRDGSGPMGALALDKGVLYGGTAFGGAFGHGAVFRLTPPVRSDGRWTNTTLYATQFAEGDRFESGVTRAADGTLYVAAKNGGNNTSTAAKCPNKGCGTVFKLVPPANPSGKWRYVNLHRFSGVDGTAPVTALTLVGRHAFGTTWSGGNLSLPKCLSFFFRTSGCGVIYDVEP
jgi:uncharacterized repeat protein (TIGR03803 family)